MGTKAAEKVGRGPCPLCGHGVMFRKSSGGMLKFDCDECDGHGYAEPGGKAFKSWTDKITPVAGSIEKPPAAPAAPAPKPAGFTMGL